MRMLALLALLALLIYAVWVYWLVHFSEKATNCDFASEIKREDPSTEGGVLILCYFCFISAV